ncbi:hypothetical protein DOTSEDRAFT_68594 [Dothistroma septosporum NZE10]|uniref:Uncharacterized protein n=1 Tax=Dothistroma septosporum (strain NZE10 / CBS 128990) TaxID=675120 RepID=N1Q2B6_DOTSN|nr:hypothetical protein DOTSEDRAFT_68594 [Dothistroma septosporum NZE10]
MRDDERAQKGAWLMRPDADEAPREHLWSRASRHGCFSVAERTNRAQDVSVPCWIHSGPFPATSRGA